jgi:preprotein translocase subunit SecE
MDAKRDGMNALLDAKGLYGKAVQFYRDVRSELRKVSFPSRTETLASTAVVIVVVFVIAAYLGLVDLVLSLVISRVLR